MSNDDKKKRIKKAQEGEGKFPSKTIKHDPNAESARVKFGKDT